MSELLAEFMRYNQWADARLLEHCAQLTEAELDTGMDGAYGSLRQTLQHLVEAPEVFARRITAGDPGPGPTREWPGVAELARLSAEYDARLVELASEVSSDSVAEGTVDLYYMKTWVRFPRRFFFVHAMAHGTEHREQVCMMLARIGRPLDLDGWHFANAMNYGERVDGPVKE